MKRLVLHIYTMFMALTAMACQNNEVEATPSDKSVSTMNITGNSNDGWRTTGCQAYANTVSSITSTRSVRQSSLCMERKHIPVTSEKVPSDI